MCAQKLASFTVKHRLNHALGLAERNRLPVADKRKMADFNFVAGLPGSPLGQPDTSDLRPAIGASRDVVKIERVHIINPRDVFYADHALVACFVCQPRWPDEIPDRVDSRLASAQPLIDDDVRLLDFST